ncbi:MAG: hypothetical protein DMF00_17400 [Verrucomicrobia bacterium]|nr:MAG: hypothetical protein DMF00_17400 [Verrucomicrobiota bacterium]
MDTRIKWLITAVLVALLLVAQTFAGEHPTLARVTVYWKDKVSGANAAWNGVKLREGHCAVDPNVVNRRAARICARSSAEQNAIVIDRFFDAKQDALAWAQANPHFMIVKIRTSSTETTY